MLAWILFVIGIVYVAISVYSLLKGNLLMENEMLYRRVDRHRPFDIKLDPRVGWWSLASVLFGVLGAVAAIWGAVLLIGKLVRSPSLRKIAQEPPSIEFNLPECLIVFAFCSTILWLLTRPHPWDRTLQHQGAYDLAAKGPLEVPCARWIGYLVVLVLATIAFLISFAYSAEKGLVIGIPSHIVAMIYLGLGQSWKEVKNVHGTIGRYRVNHVFGPFKSVDYAFFLAIPLSWLLGCAAVGLLFLI